MEGALARAVPPDAPLHIERRFEPVPPVALDEELMTVALSNLIANAVDAMAGTDPARRRLALGVICRERRDLEPTLEKPPRELVFAVGDTGRGIPPELRDRIFYPFFTTREQGTGVEGLGLDSDRRHLSREAR